MDKEKNVLLEAALELAAAGFSVFPLMPRQKVPMTKNGVKDATIDESVIRSHWGRTAYANIGVAVGRVSGIVGIDIDFKDGCDPKFPEKLPPTVMVKTPTGGLHAYFKYPPAGIKNGLKLEKGATVRADGYYFVAVPSIHPETKTAYEYAGRGLADGEIAELPEWILNFSESVVSEKKPFEVPLTVGVGERNEMFWKLACSLRGKGFSEAAVIAGLVSLNERTNPQVPMNEIEDFARRACAYKTNKEKETRERVEFGKCASSFSHDANKPTDQSVQENMGGGGEVGDSEEEKEAPAPIFPIASLGKKIESAARVITEQVGAPLEMVCSSMLAGAALCVQQFYNIEAFGSQRPISLFFVTIAESGERKSTVDKIVLSEHYKWRKEKEKIYQDEKSRYISDLEEWKNNQHSKDASKPKYPKPTMPKAPVLFMSEPTVEGIFYCLKFHRDSIGLFADEGGAFLGGHSMKQENTKATLAKLNQLWDGSPIDRIRKGKDDGEIDVLYGKRVSAHLMLQSKLADELFNNEYAKSQGFLARCLTCQPKSTVGERKFVYTIPIPEEMSEYNKTVRMFLESRPVENPVVLIPTTEALKLIESFYYEVEPKQKYGMGLSTVRDFASKAIEHCIRIAAVLESFENPASVSIAAETMARAIEIGKFYLSGQVRTTAKSALYPSKDAEQLHQFLLKKTTWRFRDIQRVCPHRLRRKEKLTEVITSLQSAGYCTFDEKSGVIQA